MWAEGRGAREFWYTGPYMFNRFCITYFTNWNQKSINRKASGGNENLRYA